MTLVEIVQRLRIARGTNAKLRVLEKYSETPNWKLYLQYVYDTSINYGVSSPADLTFTSPEEENPVLLIKALHHMSMGNANTSKRNLAVDYSVQHGELFRLALKGSINAGVSTGTIEKAYPGLIPKFEVMLAKEAPIKEFPCLISTKYDGVRMVSFNDGHDCRLILRSGKEIRIKSIEEAFNDLPLGVYDGELVSGDGKQVSRTGITGSVNRCLKGTAKDIKDCSFCVFDFMSLKEWENKESYEYTERYRVIHRNLRESGDKVILAEQHLVHSEKDIETFYQEHLTNGYEGAIVRYLQDRYQWTRTDRLVKKKATNTATLYCSGVTEGTGKYAGLIGALECYGTVKKQEVYVKLGSGLSDHDREAGAEAYVGKHVEALYNDIVKKKNTEFYSLFLPRFKRVLGDKDI